MTTPVDGRPPLLATIGERGLIQRIRDRFPAPAGALQIGRELGPEGVVLVNLSGRGDKDVDTAARWFGLLSGDDLVEAEQIKAAEPVEEAEGSGW